jgi:hypothetical protein
MVSIAAAWARTGSPSVAVEKIGVREAAMSCMNTSGWRSFVSVMRRGLG